ncbi:unnamed protein product [Anisakis simplex]|uniref:Gag-pol polyprotein n=1 Tax=Anisakis simplex TaxID=6269 RepID=A0A0M3K2Q0_ANISI|nr:unnamed protein product [Anisakis simplex]
MAYKGFVRPASLLLEPIIITSPDVTLLQNISAVITKNIAGPNKRFTRYSPRENDIDENSEAPKAQVQLFDGGTGESRTSYRC